MAEKNKPPIPCDSWNETTFGPDVKKSFIWVLKKFRDRYWTFREGEMLSTIFTLPGPEDCVTKWQLEFHSDGSVMLKGLSNNVRATPTLLCLGRIGQKYPWTQVETSARSTLGILRSWKWSWKSVSMIINDNGDLNIFVEMKMSPIEKTIVVGTDEANSSKDNGILTFSVIVQNFVKIWDKLSSTRICVTS